MITKTKKLLLTTSLSSLVFLSAFTLVSSSARAFAHEPMLVQTADDDTDVAFVSLSTDELRQKGDKLVTERIEILSSLATQAGVLASTTYKDKILGDITLYINNLESLRQEIATNPAEYKVRKAIKSVYIDNRVKKLLQGETNQGKEPTLIAFSKEQEKVANAYTEAASLRTRLDAAKKKLGSQYGVLDYKLRVNVVATLDLLQHGYIKKTAFSSMDTVLSLNPSMYNQDATSAAKTLTDAQGVVKTIDDRLTPILSMETYISDQIKKVE